MRTSIFLFVVAGLAPLASFAGASGSFESGLRGHVLVPVSVNGAEARPFAVDTAASQTVLDAAAFASLGGDGPVPAHGAQGAHGSFAARGVAIESLSLWEAEQRAQLAALMTLSDLTRGKEPDFVGVLGLPFLGKYLLDIDYPARRLVLHDRSGQAPACDICSASSAIPVTPLNGGLPGVPVTVNGIAMRALLDTGAARTILNAKAIAVLGLSSSGTGEGIARASIALGGGSPRPHEVSHVDLPVFQTLGLGDEPALILGIDYLSAGRVVLDIEAGQAWFRPAPD
jgi:predicted aspartyl protease